jgi:hypothetical protein
MLEASSLLWSLFHHMDTGRSPFLLIASRTALDFGSSWRKRKIMSATHVVSLWFKWTEKLFDFDILFVSIYLSFKPFKVWGCAG